MGRTTITVQDLNKRGFRQEKTNFLTFVSKGEVRVQIYPNKEAADRSVDVYVFEDSSRKVLVWKTHFSNATPAEVIFAFLLKVTGG